MVCDDERDDGKVLQSPGSPGAARFSGRTLPRRRLPEPRPPRPDPATYRIRVQLDDVQPTVWRQLELGSDLTLAELHQVVQAAMGWTDSHLHHFEMGPRRDHQVMPFVTDLDEEPDEGIHERDVRLDQVLGEVGDRLFYEYDFGDSWEHTIELEAVTPYDGSAPRARCTAGDRACPPEDCGGSPGYEELLDGLAHPESASHRLRERLDWLPEGFDPAAFSIREANDRLDTTLASLAALATASATDLDENLTDMLRRCGSSAQNPLVLLMSAAGIAAAHVPDPGTQEGMVRPWLRLMELVGEDGLKLTQAGYLPPATVADLADQLDLPEWIGKRNREENVVPVAELRESAVDLGLVRKLKGRLLLTRAGKRLAGDPQGLWWHIAGSLPLGRDYERHAGVVALLVTAAGEAPQEAVRRHGPELLERAGWWVEGGLDDWHASRAAFPTLAVLRLLGCTTGRTVFDDGPVTEEGRQLARAALRSRRG